MPTISKDGTLGRGGFERIEKRNEIVRVIFEIGILDYDGIVWVASERNRASESAL